MTPTVPDGHPPVDDPLGTAVAQPRGWWARIGVIVTVLLFVLSTAAPAMLRGIGNWLIVEDELAAADVIFVHAGHLPFRSIEAGDIYREGRAREIWLAPISPTPESLALQELGIDRPPGHYWRSLVLQRRGVPRASVRLLPAPVLNTRDEVQAVIDQLLERDFTSAILVTSKQHSRRVRMLWDRLAPDGMSAIVRPSASDPFNPDGWWKNTEDGQAALHELAGIAAIWLGIGLRPERD
ncbi:MAG: hypothetical protein GKS06_04255 [Acidobacteria bacterium]|nr:hypothetical protein [Acidobacteriota bacterium]